MQSVARQNNRVSDSEVSQQIEARPGPSLADKCMLQKEKKR